MGKHPILYVIGALALGLAIMYFVRPYVNLGGTPPIFSSNQPTSNQASGDIQQMKNTIQGLIENQKILTETMAQITSKPAKIDCESLKSCLGSGHGPAPAKRRPPPPRGNSRSESSATNHTELTVTFTCINGPCNGGNSTPPPPPVVRREPPEENSEPGPIAAKKDNTVTVVVTNHREDY